MVFLMFEDTWYITIFCTKLQNYLVSIKWILTYDIMGIFQAAAIRASVVHVFSGPKNATTPFFHCSVIVFMFPSSCPCVSLQVYVSVWFGSKSLLLLMCSTTIGITPFIITPIRFKLSPSGSIVERKPTLISFSISFSSISSIFEVPLLQLKHCISFIQSTKSKDVNTTSILVVYWIISFQNIVK